jgi:hypothetical protein
MEVLLVVEEEILKRYLDDYDEPGYLFKGVAFGLFFCLPFWAIIFWLIT